MKFNVKHFDYKEELEKFINENNIKKDDIVKVEYIFKNGILYDSTYILYYYG